MTRGGARPGAGRPVGSTKPEKEKKKSVGFVFSQEVIKWLKKIKNKSVFIENLIRKEMGEKNENVDGKSEKNV